MNYLDEALHYAIDLKWAVLPLVPRGKKPATTHGVKDATKDPEQIKAWWTANPEYNIGIATGHASGFFVVDVDGEIGGQSLVELLSGHPPLRTRFAHTGGDGLHLYLKMPDAARGTVRNRTAVLPGIDIRGEGGYVVAPDSLHESGERYTWLDERDIAEAPEYLMKVVMGDAEKQEARCQKPEVQNGSAYAEKAFREEIGAVAGAAKGTRNDTLNRAAFNLGTLVGAEMLDRTTVEEALLSAARTCALPADEAHKTIRSGIEAGVREPRKVSYPPPGGAQAGQGGGESADDVPVAESYLTTKPLTDLGNAECLAQLFGDRLRYEFTGRQWRVWSGYRWRYDLNGEQMRLAVQVVRGRQAAFSALSNRKNDSIGFKYALHSENLNRLHQLLDCAQSLGGFATTIGQYDTHKLLAGAGPMTLDLEKVVARPAKQEDYLTLQLGTEYDEDALCPRWNQFLMEVFNEDDALIRYIQRAWGYSLTGDISEQKMFLCHGTGANGKSTFLSVLGKLLGEYSGATSFSTFDAETTEARADLARLRGCRVVTVIEAEEDARLNEPTVKSVTGGDWVTARAFYANAFNYQPMFKLWMAMNHKPVIRGTDRGIWRRIQLIPFTQNFEGRRDLKLEQTLSGELPGILNWAMDGLRMWQGMGLNPPPAVAMATEEYRQESDTVGQWLEADYDSGQGYETVRAAAYEDYKYYAEQNGMRPMSSNSLGRRLIERGIQRGRTGKGVPTYLGIKLKDNAFGGK